MKQSPAQASRGKSSERRMELFRKHGKPKLAIFVRQSLWDVREDRLALERYIQQDFIKIHELSDAETEKLTKHASRFVNDAETAFEFLQEVGQVAEMKEAVKGSSDLPKGNWIHRFSTFAEIADAMRIALGVTTNAERKILMESLKQELLRNLCHLVHKTKDHGIMEISDWANSTISRITGGNDGKTKLRQGDLNRLIIFQTHALGMPRRLATVILEQAIRSGLFMIFDPDTGTYKSTGAQNMLLELLAWITNTQQFADHSAQLFQNFAEKFKPTGRAREIEVTVDNLDLLMPCAEAKTFGRIIELASILVKYIDASEQTLGTLKAFSPSPVPEESARLEAEKVPVDEVRAWLSAKK